MRDTIARVARRLVPELAKLLATGYGGPVAGAAAKAFTEEALDRIAAAAERLFPGPVEPGPEQDGLPARIEAAIAQQDPRIAALTAEIQEAATALRERYVEEYLLAEREREQRSALVVAEERIRTEAQLARENMLGMLALRNDFRILAYMPALLSAAVLAGFFFVLARLLGPEALPTDKRELAYLMLGALTTSLSAVVTFWFGSSAEAARRSAVQQQESLTRERLEAGRTIAETTRLQAARPGA